MKKDIPKVSIGMPVYNGDKFLRQALDSLLSQKYTNFELIISDNASIDETENICKEYAARDVRIKYIRQVRNLGSHENFNFVLRKSHGEYFMWAASDDQWEANFIQSLFEALEKRTDAIGASPPYQLVNEDTESIIEGLWRYNYESRHTFFRLIKFCWQYNDACIYGLIRRKYMDNVKFIPWSWINAGTPYNIAYPLVFLLLAKGDFLMVGEKPLWFKNIKISHGHSRPFFANPFLGYLAHIVRKINLLVRSARYIYLGSRSALLVLSIFPILLLRVVVDSLTPIYAALYIWASGKKITQLSPHEIWRLGVR